MYSCSSKENRIKGEKRREKRIKETNRLVMASNSLSTRGQQGKVWRKKREEKKCILVTAEWRFTPRLLSFPFHSVSFASLSASFRTAKSKIFPHYLATSHSCSSHSRCLPCFLSSLFHDLCLFLSLFFFFFPSFLPRLFRVVSVFFLRARQWRTATARESLCGDATHARRRPTPRGKRYETNQSETSKR